MHRRILLIATGLVVVLPIATAGIFISTFNANGWKPRIQEAMTRAVGREISLNGPISLKWSLVPTIELRDVALANINGGSRPQMVTAQSVEAQIALLPLLSNRIVIPHVVVIKPDALIETTRDNRENWVFGNAATPVLVATPENSIGVEIKSVKVEDGTLTWRNGTNGQTVTVALNSFELRESTETSSVTFGLVATYVGTRFEVNGETGSTARLRDTAAQTSWPVKLKVTTTGAEVLVEAQSTTPLQPVSFSGKIAGRFANLAQFQLFIPRTTLPSVQGLTFSANIASNGPLLTRITDIAVHAGTSDLSAYAQGLTLTQVDIRSARLDQPVAVKAEGNYADAPIAISAMLGASSDLIEGKAFPLDVSLAVAGATATAKGALSGPARVAGADLVISARIPELAPFAALVRRPVPDLKDIVFDAHLAWAPGGFANGVALTQAKLSFPQGNIAGDMSVTFVQPPSVAGNATSKQIDLDALLEVKSVNPPATAGRQAAPAPPQERRGNLTLLLSDAPLNLGMLRKADADLQLRIGELRTGGQTHRDVAGHFVLKHGELVLDPISGTLPAGKMKGRLSIDANPPQPSVALVLRAPGLSLRTLALTLGLPSGASGSLEVDANLSGGGDSLHAIAAGLNGTFGLAMVNGEIDNSLLNHLLGPILTSASLPLSLINPGQSVLGSSALRCFAARLDARDGRATFRALYLDSARVKVSGSGTVNLADETLSLRLRPLARLANTGITVPLIVGGTIATPNARVDAANSAQANLMGVAQSARNLAELPLGVISGTLGGRDRLSSGGDDCSNQLSIARGGVGGPQPNSPPSLTAVPANAARKILNAPKRVLRNPFDR